MSESQLDLAGLDLGGVETGDGNELGLIRGESALSVSGIGTGVALGVGALLHGLWSKIGWRLTPTHGRLITGKLDNVLNLVEFKLFKLK